jgi:two-component system CheB/CheR fusion protein
LEDERLSLSIQLFGTDASEKVVGKARAGIYHDSGVTTLSAERLRRFFVKTDAGYQIAREVRDMCIFACHNLGNDPPLSHMDLISCRNLLIYFGPALQQRVIDRLAYALQPTGCLLLGSSESTGRLTELFDALDEEHKIYCRNPTVPARASEFITSLVSEPHISVAVPELFEHDVAKSAVHTLVDRMLLSRYGPSGVVVNKDLRIIEFRGEVDRFIRTPSGTPNLELLAVVREDLAVHLRAAIEEAHDRKTTVRLDEIQVRRDRAFYFVRITIIPVAVPSSDAHTVILFEDLADTTSRALKRVEMVSPSAGADVAVFENPQRHIEHLEHELAASREYLQSIIEELRSTNEEAQSVNEELQSTNEELQTTKEELQASNEELNTINAEMKSRNVQLGESNDDLTNLLSSINTPIIMVDNDLRIRRFTPAAEKVLHLIPADVGRPISDIKPRINVPDLDSILTRVLDSLAGHEQEVQDSDGRGYLMRVRPYRTANNRIEGAVLILVDISDLKSSEARYRQLFESAHDGIIIVDVVTGEIADLNPHTEQLLGYSREEMIGQKLWETDALREDPGIRAALEQIRDQGVVRLSEITLTTKDGREIQTELVGNVYTEGNRRAIQLNIRDLTERRKFERELQHTQKLESLGLLAGGVAHDFNNLLTGILGNASLVYAETASDNPLRPPLREIVRASERAADLTRQLLAYAGKGRFVVEAIRLSDLISEILMLVRASISKNVELKVDLTPGLPSIEADVAQIQQLIMNLVINGAEAIGEGEPGTVEIRTASRQLSAQDARENFGFEALVPGTYVTLEIKDTGSGMDEATKAKIFDPFFTTKFTGRGLGLAAALGIVKTLHGAIRVYSIPSRGTSFHVFFPATSTEVVSRTRRPPKRMRGSGTVLVIDDENTIRQFARAVLQRNGFEVLVAENGQVGLDLFRSNQDRIALIVLDLTMPVMGGEQAFDQLRAIRGDVPVLLSSGHDERDAAIRFAGKDFAGFLQKPYDVNRLVEVVSSALGLRTEE